MGNGWRRILKSSLLAQKFITWLAVSWLEGEAGLAWRRSEVPNIKSELEESLDVYQTKQDRTRYLEIGIGIATGLLKGLPPVIITNVAVIFVMSVGTYDLSIYSQYVRDVAWTTLIALLEVYTFMVWLSVVLVPRLTKNMRHSEDELAMVNALRKITVQGFHSYIGHLPRIRPEKLHWSNLDDTGRLDRGKHNLEWRKILEIPPSVRDNMVSFSRLTLEMDVLSEACVKFAGSFDKYSSAFVEVSARWDIWKQGEADYAKMSQYMKSAIIGSYLFFSGFVPNEAVVNEVRNSGSLSSEIETFLREFLKGNPTDPKVISSLQTRNDLRQAAEEAFKTEQNAMAKLEIVEPAVKEMHEKWKLRLQ